MNPFIAFCLYVAARVFIHILKKNPNDAETRSSLEFLLAAMQQIKTTNPLSESFLIQLGLDLQGAGMDSMLQNSTHSSTVKAKLEIMVSPCPPSTTTIDFISCPDLHIDQTRVTACRLFTNHRHTRQQQAYALRKIRGKIAGRLWYASNSTERWRGLTSSYAVLDAKLRSPFPSFAPARPRRPRKS